MKRSTLPAEVWIEWMPFPRNPWRVMSASGSVYCADSVERCSKWMARHGYKREAK